MSRVADANFGGAKSNDAASPETKKKKKRRAFGDETAVARDKRDRRIEKAVEKGVRRRERSLSKARAEAEAGGRRSSPSSRTARSAASGGSDGAGSRHAAQSSVTMRTGNRSRSTTARRRGEGGSKDGSRRGSSFSSRGRSIKGIAEDGGEMRRSFAETKQCSRPTLGSSADPGRSEEKKKKKKSRRMFGDEAEMARDKRERKIEKAIVKEVVKQSKVIAREQAKALAEGVSAEADADADASPREGGMEKTKSSKRTFDEEVRKAQEKVEIERALQEELIEKELNARRIERSVERQLSGGLSRSFKRSKSLSRVSSSHGGRHPGFVRSKSCGRAVKPDEDEESAPDAESLWRGGKFQVKETDDCGPPAALVHLAREGRGGGEATRSARSIKSNGAVGPGMFPLPIRHTLLRLDSLLNLAGTTVVGTASVRGLSELTTEVLDDAGHNSHSASLNASKTDIGNYSEGDSEILRKRPANPSARCRAMEEEIAQKKMDIVKAIDEEKEMRHKFEQLSEEKRRLVEENTRSQNAIREANRTSKFLNDEVNRLRKNNAELVPVIKALKIDVWRAKKDRDELRKISYGVAEDAGKSEYFLRWKDWLSDDLMKEEVRAGEDKKAMLAWLSKRVVRFSHDTGKSQVQKHSLCT